jgi:hypothetical protein
VNPESNLDVTEKRKISCPYRESNLDSSVAILTEVSNSISPENFEEICCSVTFITYVSYHTFMIFVSMGK